MTECDRQLRVGPPSVGSKNSTVLIMGCGASAQAPPPAEAVVTSGDGSASATMVAKPAASYDGPIDPRVSAAFALCDKNEDGVLSKGELMLALRKQESVRTTLGMDAVKFDDQRTKFDEVFSKMDTDGSDSISVQELMGFLKDALPAAGAAAGSAGAAAPAAGAKQSALVFVKPHANTAGTIALVKEKFGANGISIAEEGEITGPVIDSKKLIDQHYYAIASKATILPPKDLPVPADKFKEKFGEEWSDVLEAGRVFNALDAKAKLGFDDAELDKVWKASTPADKCVKFGGGFYCALLEPEGQDPIYSFNCFFMSMRGKFTAADAAIHYFVVEFDPSALPWSKFRGEVLGPTDPAKAPEGSLRATIFKDYESLGLPGVPNVTDNGVHASASPFEGLAERMNWLGRPLSDDAFGKALLDAGIDEATIKAWTVDPRVPMPDGSTGSLFDALEDLDLADCVAKAVAISKAAA